MGKSTIIWIVVAVLIIGGAIGGYMYYTKTKAAAATPVA